MHNRTYVWLHERFTPSCSLILGCPEGGTVDGVQCVVSPVSFPWDRGVGTSWWV